MKHTKSKIFNFLKAISYKLKASEGITIYLAMLMLATALTTAIFISTAFVREFTISKEVADSLKAVYAADTVMEYTLYQVRTIDLVNAPANLVALGFVQKTATAAASMTSTYYHLPPAGCATNINVSSENYMCDIKVVLDVDKTKGFPGCSSDAIAPDCTRIVTKGSYGAINRAMEIVYDNL